MQTWTVEDTDGFCLALVYNNEVQVKMHSVLYFNLLCKASQKSKSKYHLRYNTAFLFSKNSQRTGKCFDFFISFVHLFLSSFSKAVRLAAHVFPVCHWVPFSSTKWLLATESGESRSLGDIKFHVLLKETDEQQKNLSAQMREKQEGLIHFILSLLSNLFMYHSKSARVYDFTRLSWAMENHWRDEMLLRALQYGDR